jgi:hypothetical protein
MNNPPGQTILWDSIGETYLDNKWWAAMYPELTPVVIVLSDGADLQSADTSAAQHQKLESGSGYWAPWANESDGMQYYPFHRGKYTMDMWDANHSTEWVNAMDHGGSVIRDRVGLLSAEMQIFTIGLGVEHHDNPGTPDVMEVWEPVLTTWPGEGIEDPPENATCIDQAPTDDPTVPCLESGTVEYNLWRIANTSDAEYFYAPDADDLEGIFITLGMMLAHGINQTKAGPPVPQTNALHDNSDKMAVTDAFNLTDLVSAKLTFWQKYNMLAGGHGGFLQVGYKDPTVNGVNDWDWRYVIPGDAYTGNLYYEEYKYDSFGNRIFFCWNGLSGGGQFNWEHIGVDLLGFVPEAYRGEVRVKFNYTQFGGGTGVGWWLDDVRLTVSRSDLVDPNNLTKDVWNLTDAMAHSGNYSWSNVDPVTGMMKPGIDNYLVTSPIDLTNAKNAYMSAYFKFNFNDDSGAPPDGFRVEITANGGQTWTAVNLGVRSSWGVSGTGLDNEDGATDGKAYTGLCDSGNYITDDYWVSAETLSRVNCDLSAWIGNQIILRFRVVTNNLLDTVYPHYEDPGAGFGGFYVDDVIVHGETIFG